MAKKQSKKKTPPQMTKLEQLVWAFECATHHVAVDETITKATYGYIYYGPGSKDIVKLIKNGYIALVLKGEGPVSLRKYWYKRTQKGIDWWIDFRLTKYKKTVPEMAQYYEGEYNPCTVDPARLLEAVDGKGICCRIRFCSGNNTIGSVFAALKEGYFTFYHHNDYTGRPHCFEEYITVTLTAKGQKYFDSVPRLVLECA